jgi:hypothetical protein
MTMGKEDFLDSDALLRCGILQLIKVAAWISEGAAHGFGAPDQAAILLQRCDGNDGGFERHYALHVAWRMRKGKMR